MVDEAKRTEPVGQAPPDDSDHPLLPLVVRGFSRVLEKTMQLGGAEGARRDVQAFLAKPRLADRVGLAAFAEHLPLRDRAILEDDLPLLILDVDGTHLEEVDVLLHRSDEPVVGTCAVTGQHQDIVGLHRLAEKAFRSERPDHTLQATALVHEAWLKLNASRDQQWEGRRHYFGAAAEAMRRILVEHARRRNAAKRGGLATRVTLQEARLPARSPARCRGV